MTKIDEKKDQAYTSAHRRTMPKDFFYCFSTLMHQCIFNVTICFTKMELNTIQELSVQYIRDISHNAKY